jgi:hypothetical protein
MPGSIRAEVVEGFGRDQAAARNAAMLNAQDKVRELLRQQLGPDYQATHDQISQEKLLQFQVVRPGSAEPTVVSGEQGFRVNVDVNLNEPYLNEVKNANRHERIALRQWFLARVLAELVVVLLVTTGYLRLEQLTAGYYTGLLRLGAVLVVVLTGLGLWLTL